MTRHPHAGDGTLVSARVEDLDIDLAARDVALGLVVARGCVTQPASPDLAREIDAAIAAAKQRTDLESITTSVRDLLRFGKYRPTGRGKPASEYLHRAACEDRFPRINNLVDINNLISLRSLLPISLVDLTRAEASSFRIRRGNEGESYVFNATGQTIDLGDLLLVARLPADEPCANPVKDSMATKLLDGSTEVLAVLYAPSSLASTLRDATSAFEQALRAHGGARTTASTVLTS